MKLAPQWLSRGRSAWHWLSVGLCAVVMGCWIPDLQAAVTSLASDVSLSGTAPFDATSGPGNDVSATDQVVRTNDDITYLVQMGTSSTAAATYKLVLPNCDTPPNQSAPGVYIPGCSAGKVLASWTTLPPQCSGAGSAISADKQTLTCVRSLSGLNSILPVVRVSSAAPNGANLAALVMTATSADTGVTVFTGTDTEPNLLISAAPRWDLAKGDLANVSSSKVIVATATAAFGPNGEEGVLLAFPLAIYSKTIGAKGAELVSTNSVSITDVVANVTSDDPVWQAALRANLQPYNPNGAWPGAAGDTVGGCPVNAIAGSYRLGGMPWFNPADPGQSGTCAATQAGGPGSPITVNITGINYADTNSQVESNLTIPTYASFVQARKLLLWAPLSVLPATGTHTITNTYSPLTGLTGISGQPNVDPNPANNTSSVPYQILPPGAGWSKAYAGVGELGSTRGTGSVAGNSDITVKLLGGTTGSSTVQNMAVCDKLDNTRNVFRPTGALVSFVVRTYPAQVLGTDYVVEYGSGGLNGVGSVWATDADQKSAGCGDDQSTVGWKTNPDDPAFAHTPGTRDKITKVRVRYLHPFIGNLTFDVVLNLRTLSAPTLGPNAGIYWPSGDVTNNYLAYSDSSSPSTTDSAAAVDKMTDASGRAWVTRASQAFASNTAWDRYTLVGAAARISKQTVTPVNSATQVISGTTVTYKLIPTLTTPITGDTTTGLVIIEDILPAGMSYVVGSTKQGATPATATPITPVSVLIDTPSAGLTKVRFELPNTQVNTTIQPIYLDASVSGTLPNAVALSNITLISSPLDPENCVSSARVKLSYPYVTSGSDLVNGSLCPGASRKVLNTSSPPGFYNDKTVDKTLIGAGGTYKWTLSWIPIGTPIGYTDTIDVLPHNADGRGTNFAGSATLTNISAVTGDGAPVSDVLCATSIPTSSDPADASNWSGGVYPVGAPAALWSAANCATLANVKAVRIRSNSVQNAGAARSLTLSVATSGNTGGNIYTNRIATRGAGLIGVVDLKVVSVEVVSGSITGKVYEDSNNNGLVTGAEPGIPNNIVTVSGYSYGANGIDDGGVNNLAALGTKDDGAPFVYSTKTDASGNYCIGPFGVPGAICTAPIYTSADATGTALISLAGLPRGKVSISETQPTAYLDGKEDPTTGSVRAVTTGSVGTITNDRYNDVVLGISGAATNFNFGELKPVSLSGLVFEDKGVLNGTYQVGTDTLLAGAVVQLSGTDDLGATVNLSIPSAANGTYSFSNLRPGTYTVKEVNPSGYADSTGGSVQPGSGFAAGPGTNGVSLVSAVTMASGEAGINYNFGDVPNVVDLRPSKSVDNANVSVGQPYNYQISTRNLGSVASIGAITVTDTLDATKLIINSISVGAGWVCTLDAVITTSVTYPVTTGAAHVLSCTSSTAIAPGVSVVVVSALNVTPTALVLGGAASSSQPNSVTLTGGGETPGNGANNADTINVQVNGIAQISVSEISLGGTTTFNFTGTNGLPTAATAITTSVVGTAATVPALTNVKVNTLGQTTTLTQGPLVAGWTMVGASCTGLTKGDTPTVDTTARSVIIPATSVVANADIKCTFTNTQSFNVSGTLFNDPNGLLGTPANTVDGSGTNTGASSLTAYLIQGGNVVASSPVAADGSYTIAGVSPGSGYSVVLANTATVVAPGAAAPAPSLPTGWANVGENIGTAAGSDGSVNGISASFNVTTTSVSDVNFGIEQPPTSGAADAPNQPNPGGTATVAVPAGLFTGTLPTGATGTNASDPTTVTAIRFTALPSNTTSITLNGTSYGTCGTCTAFPAAGVTLTVAQLAGMVLDPVDGAVTPVIPYVAIDAAGKESIPGSVRLPLGTLSLSGKVFNDTNGLLGTPANTVDGSGTNAGASTLTAYLVQASKVVDSSPVAADGSYTIANLPVGSGYTVVLANTATTVLPGAAAPASSLPTGWANVGENIGTAAGSDGTVNGTSASFNVTTTSVTDVNFGIEQPPTSGAADAPSQPNPGGTATVAVPAGLFTGTLPTGATGTNASDPTAVTAIRITALPSNTTSITANGTTYGTCGTCTAFPAAGVTLTVAQLAGMVLDPVDGAVTPVIPYVSIDAAGKASTPGSVNLPLGALSVTGKVFNDTNGLLGTPANTVDGSGTNAGSTALTAYLVQGGDVVASAPVTSGGSFSINNAPPGSAYTVVLANTATVVAVGQPAPAPSLPAGWAHTGEFNAASSVPAPGSDGTVDGSSAPFNITTSDVDNLLFGIEQRPTAGSATAASGTNPGGTATVAVPAGLFTGPLPTGATGSNASDPTAVTAIRLTALPSNTNSITANGTTYGTCGTCTAFPSAGVTLTVAQLSGLVLDPVDGSVTPVIPYVALDAAGQASATPGSVSLPLSGLSISGNVFNDSNGLLGTPANTVDGSGSNAGSTALTAYLIQAGKVVASSPVAADGSYSFADVPADTGYTVVLANTATIVAPGAAAPAPSLPAGWVNTGETNAASSIPAPGSDGTVDGQSAPFDLSSTNVAHINFGVEQIPTSGSATAASQPNPGGSATVAVPPGLFTGPLPTGATGSSASDPTAVTAIRLTALPSNTTRLTAGGVTYGSCPTCTAFPAAGVTLTVAQLSSLLLDPVDGSVTPVMAYVALDAAGKPSATAGSVSLPLTSVSVSGQVFNDTNGLLGTPVNTVDGSGTNAGSTALTAYLVQAGKVVASSPVAADGNYTFANVATGTGYSVVLANTASVVAVGQAAPTPSLPAGWAHTGEFNAPSSAPTPGSDGASDGISASFDVTASVANVNFGIEQVPVAGNSVQPPVTNPGGTLTVPVPPGAFVGTPPAGATGTTASDATAVTAIRLSAMPSNATGFTVTVGGVSTTYGSCSTCTPFPAAGVTLPVADLSSLKVDPLDNVTDTTFSYFPQDAAGQASTTAGSAKLPLKTVDLKITTTAVGPFVKTQQGQYALQVSNVGSAIATGVVSVTDTLPPGLTYVPGSVTLSGAASASDFSCSAAPATAAGQVVTCTSTAAYSLPVGADFSIDFKAAIAQTAGSPCTAPLTGECVTAQATVNVPADGVPGNNTARVTTTLISGPDLTLKKTALTNPMTVNNPGQYTLQVSNVGAVDAPYSLGGAPAPVITVTDSLPANMQYVSATGTNWSCTVTGQVSSGQTVSCTTSQTIAASGGVASPITLTVKPLVAADNVINQAQVQGGGEPVLNFDSVTLTNNATPAANNNAQASVKVQAAASLTGSVWRDVNHDRQLGSAANEPRVPGFIAEVIDPASGQVVASTPTDANGVYRLDNLLPGKPLKLQFRDPATGGLIHGVPSNNDQAPTQPGSTYTAPSGATSKIPSSRDSLLVTLVSGTTLSNQSLPLDPAGVVYDSLTRAPLGGASVTLLRSGVPVPVSDLIGYPVGATSNAQTTCGPEVSASCPVPGAYQFLLLPSAPAGVYTLKVTAPNYSASSSIPPAGSNYTPLGVPGSVVSINAANLSGNPPPQVGQDTTYYTQFTLSPAAAPGVVNNHIPLDPAALPTLVITKTGDKSQVEIGDNIRYTLSVRRTDAGTAALTSVAVTDTLPAGFRYIPGTLVVNGTPVADAQAGLSSPGLTLPMLINFATPPLNASANPGLAAKGSLTISYRVRVAVGAAQGTGINRAQAKLSRVINCQVTPAACSNEAQYRVKVTGGVFTTQACVLGKVYVDCNHNHMQDPEELGIPGVRLYLNDGTAITADSEGKYSLCDLAPKTWVLKADKTTLPLGSRLVTSSSRNVGDAGSLFLDLKNGELLQADFIEGSCSNHVLEQVKARRTQGEVAGPQQGATQTEKKEGRVLQFKPKPPTAPPQATDSAQQPLVAPRIPGGQAEPGASEQGAAQ